MKKIFKNIWSFIKKHKIWVISVLLVIVISISSIIIVVNVKNDRNTIKAGVYVMNYYADNAVPNKNYAEDYKKEDLESKYKIEVYDDYRLALFIGNTTKIDFFYEKINNDKTINLFNINGVNFEDNIGHIGLYAGGSNDISDELFSLEYYNGKFNIHYEYYNESLKSIEIIFQYRNDIILEQDITSSAYFKEKLFKNYKIIELFAGYGFQENVIYLYSDGNGKHISQKYDNTNHIWVKQDEKNIMWEIKANKIAIKNSIGQCAIFYASGMNFQNDSLMWYEITDIGKLNYCCLYRIRASLFPLRKTEWNSSLIINYIDED